jgi:lauroyl/myristoyl acyltransferase
VGAAGRLVRSAFIWSLYFPYIGLLRLVGPRFAVTLTRGLSILQWLLSSAGSGRRIARKMQRLLAGIHPGLRAGTEVRKFFALRHQQFAERYVYPTARGHRFVAETYRFEGREHLDGALAMGRGVIVVFHHFGLARMIAPALGELGYDYRFHEVLDAPLAKQAYGWVARGVVEKQLRDELRAGVKGILHRPGEMFDTIAGAVERGGLVGVACDGLAGSKFADVRFLGGIMRFPTGPARLSARTGAPLVSIFSLPDGLARHRLIAHPPIRCEEDSPAAVEAVVNAYAGLLEQYVRSYPWAWWTWRRLVVEEGTGGQLRLVVSDAAAETL